MIVKALNDSGLEFKVTMVSFSEGYRTGTDAIQADMFLDWFRQAAESETYSDLGYSVILPLLVLLLLFKSCKWIGISQGILKALSGGLSALVFARSLGGGRCPGGCCGGCCGCSR